ncbi:MAG: helix-turn-helix transcriptional regulator [Candidatus Magnetominusculus sp. LBB02]|nr:helix-turn-helix transcriptional regulator [Candidatus Magnetominusculus sp. LBB02]
MMIDYNKLINSGYVEENLSGADMLALSEITHMLSLCVYNRFTCCEDNIFNCLINRLKTLIPFDAISFSLMRYKIDHDVKSPQDIVIINPAAHGFPLDYINDYKKYYEKDPLIVKMLDKEDCYHWQDGAQLPDELAALCRRLGLNSGYTSGQKDNERRILYCYTLAGGSMGDDIRSHIILYIVSVFIKLIMCRLFSSMIIKPPDFTARELEIINLISKGSTNDQISMHLSISVNTVKSHIAHLLEKIGAKNKTHAVALSYEHGILR